MKRIFILTSFFCPTLLCSQTLNGIITQMNSHKKGIPGAAIASLGANPVVSQNDGYFKLIYAHKKTGEGVAFQIEKKGFEVVNKDALFTYLGNQYDTVRIYLCRKGELDSLRIKYYDISVKNIKKRYEEEIAKLNADNQKDRQQIAVLNQQLKAAISHAEDLAKRFSVVNLDDCSELFRNAFHLFEQGKIAEAIDAIPDSIVELQINAANLQIEEAEIMDSIAQGKKGKALEVIRMIQSNRNLSRRAIDSLQHRTMLLLEKTSGLNELIHHADILFCLREWESAITLYKKILINQKDILKRRTYQKRLQYCMQAIQKAGINFQ